jgi:hypothetical protein
MPDKYSSSVWDAVQESSSAAHRGEAVDRLALLGAALELIDFLVRDPQGGVDGALVPHLARLNYQLTGMLDWIVRNSTEDDSELESLRQIARSHPDWPAMVRPGDPKFSKEIIDKLQVGTDAVTRRFENKPPSFATPSNRLADQLVTQLLLLARRTCGKESHIALTNVKSTLKEPDDERAHKVLDLVREIAHLPEDSPALTKATVKKWNRWISEFVVIVDPDLTKFPELSGKEKGKTDSYTRSMLQRFFHPALKNLAKKAPNDPLSEPLPS